MLKSEFDILYHSFFNKMFENKSNAMTAAMYGVQTYNFTAFKDFILLEIMRFIWLANKNKNPKARLIVPAGIAVSDMNGVISNIKNQLL